MSVITVWRCFYVHSNNDGYWNETLLKLKNPLETMSHPNTETAFLNIPDEMAISFLDPSDMGLTAHATAGQCYWLAQEGSVHLECQLPSGLLLAPKLQCLCLYVSVSPHIYEWHMP